MNKGGFFSDFLLAEIGHCVGLHQFVVNGFSGEYNKAFHDVPEFAHVTGPFKLLQSF
jgi:hypothetical protein